LTDFFSRMKLAAAIYASPCFDQMRHPRRFLVIPALMAMNLLSGSATPLESMPVWLQQAVQISPAMQFVSFSQAVLYRGADISIVWPQIAAMAGISSAFFFVSLKRFRKAIVALQ